MTKRSHVLRHQLHRPLPANQPVQEMGWVLPLLVVLTGAGLILPGLLEKVLSH